ncbi:MAG TPA: HEAT repeat domain-containing protein [Planctomycetota bacterium]|nr:HEAT repeat domain-containing protein [Planctomycetota bacterium]
MKPVLLTVVLLLLGIGTGYYVGTSGAFPGARGEQRVDTREVLDLRERRVEDLEKIRQLEARIAELERLLAAKAEEEVPYPGDTPEELEKLLEAVYGENNIDLFLDVLDRLLCMGEKGWPILRRMIMDIIFKARFLPSQSDFRVDQLYRFGRIFANREKQLMGFMNYLLLEKDTHPWLKQGALMGGAFYVGSKAPGSEELSQTMMQLFLENAGMNGAAMPGMIPGNIGKKMQIFAVAMSGNKEMIPSLREEYRSTKDKDIQSDIVGALAYLGDPGALPLIQERLDPKQGDFTREIGALGRIGTEEAHATATAFLRQIPDSQRFYRHARDYVRQGGGASAVLLIRDRIQADPKDPEVANTIGTLRRFPTQESLDTLNLIATSASDPAIQRRAGEAATEVDNRLKGILPPQ